MQKEKEIISNYPPCSISRSNDDKGPIIVEKDTNEKSAFF
jgi:hypothetical protein